jgi:iron complex outermembrane receptor protein
VNNVTAIYPNGFLPQINVRSTDYSLTTGVRGRWANGRPTIKASYGRNRLDYRTQATLNATYGAASQTSFYDGAMIYDQWLGGMDASRAYKLGGTDLNVAWGVEVRREGYRIIAGEPASYNRGPLSSNTALTSGAQGFIGFQRNTVNVNRLSNAIYLDLEAKLPKILTLGAAVRGEALRDFGDIATGKLSARADLAKWLRCAAPPRRASARPRCNSSISPRPLRCSRTA